MTKEQVQELLHQAINGRLRNQDADYPLNATESYYERQEALCRLALANLETQEWLIARSADSANNHREVRLIRMLRGEQP